MWSIAITRIDWLIPDAITYFQHRRTSIKRGRRPEGIRSCKLHGAIARTMYPQ